MNPKIRSVIAFFDANLHRQIRMTEITALTDLSHSRLDHLFRAEVGQSPKQYLQELSLKQACQLLEATSLKITLVGLAVGYQDHSHLKYRGLVNQKLLPLLPYALIHTAGLCFIVQQPKIDTGSNELMIRNRSDGHQAITLVGLQDSFAG